MDHVPFSTKCCENGHPVQVHLQFAYFTHQHPNRSFLWYLKDYLEVRLSKHIKNEILVNDKVLITELCEDLIQRELGNNPYEEKGETREKPTVVVIHMEKKGEGKQKSLRSYPCPLLDSLPLLASLSRKVKQRN